MSFLVKCVLLASAAALQPGSQQQAGRLGNLDFGGAINEACLTLDALANGDQGAEAHLSDFLRSSVLARGLFVSLLATDEKRGALADHPAVVNAVNCAQAENTVAELSVMNLIMPTATALAHRPNSEAEAASEATKERAKSLLMATLSSEDRDGVVAQRQRDHLLALQKAIPLLLASNTETIQDDDELIHFWISFCQKWEYNADQQRAIASIVHEVLS